MIPVLDHGHVALVDHMGDDTSVARAARHSLDAAALAGADASKDAKLISFLWRNHHTTPFEAVEFQFALKVPIFVWRQLVRHRTWRWWTINEVSARYQEMQEEFYVPALDKIGTQDPKRRQGRVFDAADDDDLYFQRLRYIDACKDAFMEYTALLSYGWPRELARCILPLATYTSCFAKVDLLNLLHLLELRMDPHAQYEVQVYAWAMLELIEPIIPACIAAWRGQ